MKDLWFRLVEVTNESQQVVGDFAMPALPAIGDSVTVKGNYYIVEHRDFSLGDNPFICLIARRVTRGGGRG